MSKKKGAVPDAWDDDWEQQADKMGATPEPEPEVRLSKAERKAMHAETNKQIWAAAEAPDRPMFLQARDEVIPLKADFKPTMKVLSRKPPPKVASATAALANTHLDDDEDSEEEERRKAEADFAERQVRAQREREEKQRKYQEVRERLFGSNTAGAGAGNSNDNQSRSSSTNEGSRNSSRGKGRGRARNDVENTGEEVPARPTSSRKQLFDPGYTAKPNSTYLQKREGGGSGTHTPTEERPIRAPRGPDSSGRGGFGFAPRGNKTGPSV